MERLKEIFIFAGEMSADLHGEKLIHSLRQKNPSIHIFGVGGPRMRRAGMECILPMEAFQVMGFIDVLLALPKLLKHLSFLKKTILKRNPETAIFIDYADFNMLLESKLRKKGYAGKLIHYISPSVWAWRKNRINTLSKNLDLLLVIYPFEVNCFAGTPLKVEYVGHPLVERLNQHDYQTNTLGSGPILSLFPGSRKKELVRNFPLMLQTISYLKIPSLTVAVSLCQPRFKPLLEEIARAQGFQHPLLFIPAEQSYELMKASHLALAKSGTVTLELALHHIPTAVLYKITPLDQWIGKNLFKIILPYYCIVNILLEKQVFPEFIGHDIAAETLARSLQELHDNPLKREICQQDCREIEKLLTQKKTAEEAATAIHALTP